MTSEGSNTTAITLRKPTKDDGYRLHQLVAECPPLDPNSIYCNLLQCSHFAETGVAAEKEGDLVGFISGYIPPQQRSEEHTSELQSRENLVCRLLLEKKKKTTK